MPGKALRSAAEMRGILEAHISGIPRKTTEKMISGQNSIVEPSYIRTHSKAGFYHGVTRIPQVLFLAPEVEICTPGTPADP